MLEECQDKHWNIDWKERDLELGLEMEEKQVKKNVEKRGIKCMEMMEEEI